MERRLEYDGAARIVAPVAPATRIDGKGRKKGATRENRWIEVLRETLSRDGVDFAPGEVREDYEEPKEERDAFFDLQRDHNNNRGDGEDGLKLSYEDIIKIISEDPMVLLDCHSGGPTRDPNPGTWVNSTA